MTKDGEGVPVGPTKTDYIVSALKGLAGAVPVAGTIIGEIIGQVIPNQRVDRLEAFVKSLHDRLEELGQPIKVSQFDSPDKVDLFEDGVLKSSRALSQDRIDYISRIVALGLTGEEKDRIQAKRLLNILDEIDDDQIIILSGYLRKNHDDKEFAKKHAAILRPVPVHLGSDQSEVDEGTLHQLARTQLRTLGLLASRYAKIKKGEIPEFDEKTGMMTAGSTHLTSLGRFLLRQIGLADVRDH